MWDYRVVLFNKKKWDVINITAENTIDAYNEAKNMIDEGWRIIRINKYCECKEIDGETIRSTINNLIEEKACMEESSDKYKQFLKDIQVFFNYHWRQDRDFVAIDSSDLLSLDDKKKEMR